MQALKRRKRRAPTGRLCVGAFFISEFGLIPGEAPDKPTSGALADRE